MHLHRPGAAKTQSISFVSDGAVWIWDRIGSIVKQAGIPDSVKIHEVLDNCHAVHHVSLALSALGISDEDRNPLYRELRTHLRNGQWRSVVEELEMLSTENQEYPRIQTEVSYLRHHGEAGHLAYPAFRGHGLPLGSGAIESRIRRVINLRLKGLRQCGHTNAVINSAHGSGTPRRCPAKLNAETKPRIPQHNSRFLLTQFGIAPWSTAKRLLEDGLKH